MTLSITIIVLIILMTEATAFGAVTMVRTLGVRTILSVCKSIAGFMLFMSLMMEFLSYFMSLSPEWASDLAMLEVATRSMLVILLFNGMAYFTLERVIDLIDKKASKPASEPINA